MRTTRNTTKNTPTPKKPAKGTPGSKGKPKTSAAENEEVIAKTEGDDVLVDPALDAPESSKSDTVTSVHAGSDTSAVKKEEAIVQGSEEGKSDDAMEVEASKDDEASDIVVELSQASESKPQIVQERETVEVPDCVTQDLSSDAKPEGLQEQGKTVDQSKNDMSEQSQPGGEEAFVVDIKVLNSVEEGGIDSRVEEDKETGKDHSEEQNINTAEDEEGAVGSDEENDGEEEEDDESEDDLVEPKPVTERQKRKELEVFVGGLHRDATEEEVKKAFDAVGEVVELRLMKFSHSEKNKGYAFVRFATADQARRAASELDKTKIRDRECAVVPSEDNDTLFMGNVCKSWTSEQVSEKLKTYGVKGIEEIILVEDPENEDHNRGHAFLEFETHKDAMKAFKRLIKPDAIFGCDRSARVAWAIGTSEPDELVMAQVKSVFVSGIPPEWDDSKVKEHFGKYGSIDRVVLAKNFSKSKRADYAFVNYALREAAMEAIEALNDVEFVDGHKKVTLKVELAKPAPRKKRVKGHRGSFPVDGAPPKRNKDKGSSPGASRVDQRRDKGRRTISHGGDQGGHGSLQKNNRGVKRKTAEERSMPKEWPRKKRQHGPRVGAAIHPVGRGNRGGTTSRPGRPRAQSEEDYLPLGARMSPIYASSRRVSNRAPPQDISYPSRPAERGYVYSGFQGERSYPSLDEEAIYYEADERSYLPRRRDEYADVALGVGSLYPESLRGAQVGQGSVGGHNLAPVRGSRGYAPSLSRGAVYSGCLPAARDPRGASHPLLHYGRHAAGLGPFY